jgi:hypothetical protein
MSSWAKSCKGFKLRIFFWQTRNEKRVLKVDLEKIIKSYVIFEESIIKIEIKEFYLFTELGKIFYFLIKI